MGPSGSGKSTFETYLCNTYGMQPLRSYTTRPPRSEDDNTHTFISAEQYKEIPSEDIVAYTYFDGNHYCSTVSQIETSDTYVVDPDGVDFFMSHYHGAKIPVVIHFDIPEHVCLARLRDRDGSLESASHRITHDREKFAHISETLSRLNPKWQLYTVTEDTDMEHFAKYLIRRLRLAESYFNGKTKFHRYVLYTVDCPKCKILERKLDEKGIEYQVVKDLDTMLAMGMMSAPMFRADGELMDYKAAIQWLSSKE